MQFTVTRRVYVTEDGELVPEGDVRARFLKYGEGTVLTGDEAAEVAAQLAGEVSPEPEQVETKPVSGVQVKPVRKRTAKRV